MKYIDFQDTFRDLTAISTIAIEKAFPAFDRKVLVAWQKKGYIQKLRNNWYCFANRQFTEQDLFLIANKIYHPSSGWYKIISRRNLHLTFLPKTGGPTIANSGVKHAEFYKMVNF